MSDHGANGLVERKYFCSRCGHWLFGTTVPLGTEGTVRVECAETGCSQMNLITIGQEPLPRADRLAWAAERELQRRRHRATSF